MDGNHLRVEIMILPIIFFFISTLEFPQTGEYYYEENTSDSLSIFLIKERWHTGIIFKKEDIDTNILPVIRNFPNSEFLDVGWGDREFYLHRGFDYVLAFKALFYPTPTVIRIEGINSINNYLSFTDAAAEIKISKDSFEKLCRYVQNTFYRNKNNKIILAAKRNNGRIKYYKSNGSYSMFNTCNTWIAKGLRKAGFDISDNIIITEQIFREVQNFGKIVKAPDN